jgi:hypothetical protein
MDILQKRKPMRWVEVLLSLLVAGVIRGIRPVRLRTGDGMPTHWDSQCLSVVEEVQG